MIPTSIIAALVIDIRQTREGLYYINVIIQAQQLNEAQENVCIRRLGRQNFVRLPTEESRRRLNPMSNN